MLKYPGEGLGVLHYLRMRDTKYLCICVGSPVPSLLENAINGKSPCASKLFRNSESCFGDKIKILKKSG